MASIWLRISVILKKTGNDPNRLQWVRNTISHNTVMVDAAAQKNSTVGTPLHFDDAGKVKVMDIDASNAYDQTSIYRRSLVMVQVNEDISYGIDFFRVKGGNEHLYSFHSQSNEISGMTGFDPIAQEGGTYAGVDIPWGPGEANGYSWLKNVEKAENVNQFSVDFKINDFHTILSEEKDLHLKLTMLNDFALSDVSLADGVPPQLPESPSEYKYLLARRTGENLDSLFTTVLEPYCDDSYIVSAEAVPVRVVEGEPGADDTAKAIKVVLRDGRIDYIVHATNTEVQYLVDEKIEFRGAFGVCSIKNGKETMTYINDGDLIGDQKDMVSRHTGTVVDFEKELNLDNSITVSFNELPEIDKLVGKYIYIENDGVQNGDYKILGTEYLDNQTVKLDIGSVSLIRSYYDKADVNSGFVYNIAEGQNFVIPSSSISVFESSTDGHHSGSSNQEDSYDWAAVIEKLNAAEKGAKISVTLKSSMMMPATVIDALTGKGVTLVIVIGDKEYAINGLSAMKSYDKAAVYYMADELIAMAQEKTAASTDANPETGGEILTKDVASLDSAAISEPALTENPTVIEPTAPTAPEGSNASEKTGTPVWAFWLLGLTLSAIAGFVSLSVWKKRHVER